MFNEYDQNMIAAAIYQAFESQGANMSTYNDSITEKWAKIDFDHDVDPKTVIDAVRARLTSKCGNVPPNFCAKYLHNRHFYISW